jgi:hypothetical protein
MREGRRKREKEWGEGERNRERGKKGRREGKGRRGKGGVTLFAQLINSHPPPRNNRHFGWQKAM